MTRRIRTWAVLLPAAALLAAIGVRAAAPATPPASVRVLAFAVPDTVVAGELATAFGVLAAADGGAEEPMRVWHQFELCPEDGAPCTRLAPRELALEATPWVGEAGVVSAPRAGVLQVRWRVFVDVGIDTPWQVASVGSRVAVVEAADAIR